MEYLLLEKDSPTKLSETVTEHLSTGWELYKNHNAVYYGVEGNECIYFTQAVIKN